MNLFFNIDLIYILFKGKRYYVNESEDNVSCFLYSKKISFQNRFSAENFFIFKEF